MHSQVLLHHGASRTAKDDNGNTPYDLACLYPWYCSARKKSAIRKMLNPNADRGSGGGGGGGGSDGGSKDHSDRILLIVLPIVFVVLLAVLILGIAYYKGFLSCRRNQATEYSQYQ